MKDGRWIAHTRIQQAMGWSVDDAGYFVGAAARIYCHWNIPSGMLD
ncbi:MAG: DUF732 domain-containing protein [Mycobacterium sp.]